MCEAVIVDHGSGVGIASAAQAACGMCYVRPSRRETREENGRERRWTEKGRIRPFGS